MLKKGKVTGLGGLFIKAKDPELLKSWYGDHLGLACDEYGHLFAWRDNDKPEKKGHTQFSVFKEDSTYMQPSLKEFMINFRVDDLEGMMQRLKEAGLQVIGEIEEYEYGKFGWVMDPEGNKIELWEPVDDVFLKEQGENS